MRAKEDITPAVLRTWQRWEAYVRRAFVRLVGRSADLDDLTQDVFLALWQAVTRGDEIKSVRPYLSAIITHVARAHLRRRGPTLPLDCADAVTYASPQHAATLQEERDLVDRWLMCLTEEQRVAVVSRHFLDMKLAQIAAAFELPRTTVNNRYAKAIQNLRQIAQRLR